MKNKNISLLKSEDTLHNRSQWVKRIEQYLPEMVYGSIDGIVTTFAVVEQERQAPG